MSNPTSIVVLDGNGAAQTVSTLDGAVATLKNGAQNSANSVSSVTATDDPLIGQIGIVTETAPASDTASSGLNGRLQRIAQRLTSLIAKLPSALGQTTMSGALSVVLPSDQFVSTVGVIAIVGANFTTPSGTTQYSIGDLIASSATAGSVSYGTIAAARANDSTGMIRRVRLKTADTGFAGATVRVHFYKDPPTFTNGDNSAWLTTESIYLGYVDVILDKHFSDYEKGIGVPGAGSEINFAPHAGSQNISWALEARSLATPVGAKTWDVVLEILQN